MLLFYIVLVFLVQLGSASMAIPMENGVMETPMIVCGAHGIAVNVETEQPFSGNMYSKGFFTHPSCRFKGNGINTTVSLNVPLTAECGVRRKRTVNPRGIMLDTTIVVMFHTVFLTKIDKSYHVQCHYMETETQVTKNIDVSSLPPTELPESQELQDDRKMPICQYEVLSGGPTGSPLKYATIGEMVYHKWSCDSPQRDLYCMTVHSCTADDGQGTGQQLIDRDGCSLDQFLLPNLAFPSDLSAGQSAHVFKFADRPTVFFSCMIRLQLKEENGGNCPRPSDYCSAGSGTTSVETENRDKGDITEDFPRPDPEGINQSSPSKDFDDSEDLEERYPDKEKKRAKALRLIRDASRFAVDLDVAAAAVDVVDLQDYEASNVKDVVDMRRHDNQVCLSRLEASLSVCLFLCVSALSILLHCTFIKKLIARGNSKKRLPLPE